MKDYSEIINRFDSISDLPVSEEMIGAYIEGNLDEGEMEYVDSLMGSDAYLADLTADVAMDTELEYYDQAYADYDGYYNDGYYDGEMHHDVYDTDDNSYMNGNQYEQGWDQGYGNYDSHNDGSYDSYDPNDAAFF